ncbi:MAG: 50S ribosomal protein L13 [Hadesarchaea archaeon]|nr:50S ribosomal protein L13 [Hadesarchaea archaeon]
MWLLDATDLILGRMASRVAKKLMEGEKVIIVNADKAVISGGKKSTLSEYDAWTKIRNLVDPTQGPFHPRRPGDLIRRTVKGMLPMNKTKGREAFGRLKAYSNVPDDLTEEEFDSIPKAHLDQLSTRRFIRVGELSKHLGVES